MDYQRLLAENADLRRRLEEAEEALAAIRNGEVDALVVSSGEGEKIFTLEGADQPYRVLVESMSEGAATLSPDSTVLFCNSHLAGLLGIPLGGLLGKPLLAHVAPGDAAAFTRLLNRAMGDDCLFGATFRTELSLLTKTGETVPALFSCCSLDLGGGRGISMIVTDLSEQKRNEEIVAAGELASSILEQAGEAIIVCDAAGRVIRASRQAHVLFGSDPMLRPFDHLGQLKTSPSGESFSIAAPLRGEVFHGSEVVLHRPGRECHLLLNAKPLVMQQKIIGCVVTLIDISERKQAEEMLQSSKDRLAAALGIAQLGVWEYEFDAALTHFDQRSREVFDLTEERPLSNAEVLALIHPDDRPRVEAELNHALDPRGSGFYKAEYRVARRDGRWTWVAVRGHAVRSGEDAASKPLKFVGTLMDVTERKQAEYALKETKEAAEEANRAKSEFLANMSHEIRTPMTVFMAAIEHLLEKERNPERRHLLDLADQSANRLRTLIDDILDFSRIEARRVDLEEEPFDLPACVREVAEMFALPAREKNLRLKTELAPDVPATVIGDPNKLGQVLINLLGNAVKFTHVGEVRIAVQPRGDLLEFAVADTGIGIPDDKRGILFQSFSQADSSFTRQYGGTGLGLAISKGLVELMGGEISVRSHAGEGSVFTFTLPLRREKKLPLQADPPAEGAGNETSAARILLADDEPMIRQMVTVMLAQRGWYPETAESGRHAVEKWEQGDYDIILMDLQMPDMNGMEATQAIRKKEAEGGKRTCIIGLTAHARREIKEQCLEAGMDRVLTKPMQMKDLFSAIDWCL